MSQTDSWKTHPKPEILDIKNYEFRGITDPNQPSKLDEFSRNWSESPPGKLKFRKNIWMSFPELAFKG